MKKVLAFVLFIIMLFAFVSSCSSEKPGSEVSTENFTESGKPKEQLWEQQSVDKLVSLGYIKQDKLDLKTFATYGYLAKLLSEVCKIPVDSYKTELEKQVLGFEFYENAKISREDAAIMAAFAASKLGIEAPKTMYATGAYHWDSDKTSEYAFGSIALVSKYAIMKCDSSLEFRPKETLVIGGAADIAAKLLDAKENGNPFKPLKLTPRMDDAKTIALWLFDEYSYSYNTITNASLNENKTDLFLHESAGSLVPGKVGNALKANTAETGWACGYAPWCGSMGFAANSLKNIDDGTPSLWTPTETPMQLVNALKKGELTFDFWFKSDGGAPKNKAFFLDTGYAYDRGAAISYNPDGTFLLENYYGGSKVSYNAPTEVFDDKWHHVAFTISKTYSKNVLFVDGLKTSEGKLITEKAIPLPDPEVPKDRKYEERGFSKDNHTDVAWRQQHRYNLSIGSAVKGGEGLSCYFDEFCISEGVLYTKNFDPPQTYSKNYSIKTATSKPNEALPLLFPVGQKQTNTITLGGRKFLFIDSKLTEKSENMKITINKPEQVESKTAPFLGLRTMLQAENGDVYAYMMSGYGSKDGNSKLYISKNGVDFTLYGNIIEGAPLQADAFYDTNPDCPADEKYKLTGWLSNRGMYMYFSNDGLKWRRNESAMLPMATGGSVETYFDDQRGVYTTFVRRDGSYNIDEAEHTWGRCYSLFESENIYESWKFRPLRTSFFEKWLVRGVTGEGAIHFAPNVYDNITYQVYITRAQKYKHAPDAYFAFLQLLNGTKQQRLTELAVSRNGYDWTRFGTDWFFDNTEINKKYTDNFYKEAIMSSGMAKIGDKIYQYGNHCISHEGQNPGSTPAIVLISRLDGFVSYDAIGKGSFVTKPIIFDGNKLILNTDAAKGKVKIGIVNADGSVIEGFKAADCDIITSDGVSITASWMGKSDLSALSGKTVKLVFEMENAKLYAIKFVK